MAQRTRPPGKLHVEWVGPENAKDLLSYNVRNRPMTKRYVRQYKVDMEEGNWVFNGQPIVRLLHGEQLIALLDGQHRLKAIDESGEGQWLAFFDVDDATEDPAYVDKLWQSLAGGKTRSVPEMLQVVPGLDLKGMHARTVAAAITAVAVLDVLIPEGQDAFNSLSKAQRFDLMRRHHDEIMQAAQTRQAYKAANRAWLPIGVMAAFIACYRQWPEEAMDFFMDVARNDGLREGTAGWTLLRDLRGGDPQVSNFRALHIYWYSKAIDAWDHGPAGDGSPVRQLRSGEARGPKPPRARLDFPDDSASDAGRESA